MADDGDSYAHGREDGPPNFTCLMVPSCSPRAKLTGSHTPANANPPITGPCDALSSCEASSEGQAASAITWQNPSGCVGSGVEIRFVDLPQIEGATGRFTLQQMASVAELEAGMIGERTKRALAAAKDRGTKLGGFRGRAATADDRARASAALTARAKDHAESLAPIITRLDPNGSLSLRALAAKLNGEGLPTPAGATVWTAAGVSRLKARLAKAA